MNNPGWCIRLGGWFRPDVEREAAGGDCAISASKFCIVASNALKGMRNLPEWDCVLSVGRLCVVASEASKDIMLVNVTGNSELRRQPRAIHNRKEGFNNRSERLRTHPQI